MKKKLRRLRSFLFFFFFFFFCIANEILLIVYLFIRKKNGGGLIIFVFVISTKKTYKLNAIFRKKIHFWGDLFSYFNSKSKNHPLPEQLALEKTSSQTGNFFNGISTFVGYLMPKPSFRKNRGDDI